MGNATPVVTRLWSDFEDDPSLFDPYSPCFAGTLKKDVKWIFPGDPEYNAMTAPASSSSSGSGSAPSGSTTTPKGRRSAVPSPGVTPREDSRMVETEEPQVIESQDETPDFESDEARLEHEEMKEALARSLADR